MTRHAANMIGGAFIAFALSGCATWSTGNVDTKSADVQKLGAATDPAKITVTDKDITNLKYESLGDISVQVNKTTVFHPAPTQALVHEQLKKRASELGADAVILVRYGSGGVSMMSWGSLEGKGRAVRYVK